MDANFSHNTRNTPRIITTLPLSSSFSLKTETPLKLPEITLTQKSHKTPKNHSQSLAFSVEILHSLAFSKKPSKSEEGRKEKDPVHAEIKKTEIAR